MTAYYFDRAVYVFGSHVDNEMDEAGDGAKNTKGAVKARTRVLHKYLKIKPEAKGRYKDPSRAGKRERI